MRKIRMQTLLAITSAVCLAAAGGASAAPELEKPPPARVGAVAVPFAKPVGGTNGTTKTPPPKHVGPVTISAEAHKRLMEGAYRAIGKVPTALPPPELMKVSFPDGGKMSLNSALQYVSMAAFAISPNGQVEAWISPTADAAGVAPTLGTALRILAQNFVVGNPYVLVCTGMPIPTTTTPAAEVPINFYVSFQGSVGGSAAGPAIPDQRVASIQVTGGRGMAIAFAAPSVATFIDIRVAHPLIRDFIVDTCTVSNLN